jgi:hypothetical protein
MPCTFQPSFFREDRFITNQHSVVENNMLDGSNRYKTASQKTLDNGCESLAPKN